MRATWQRAALVAAVALASCTLAACSDTSGSGNGGLPTDSSGNLATPVAAEDALAVAELVYQPVDAAHGSGYTTCGDPVAQTPGACPFTTRLQTTVTALTGLAPGCPDQQVNPVKPDGMAFSGPDTVTFTVTRATVTGATVIASDSGPPSPNPWTFTMKVIASQGNLLVDDVYITPPTGVGEQPYDIYDSHVNCH